MIVDLNVFILGRLRNKLGYMADQPPINIVLLESCPLGLGRGVTTNNIYYCLQLIFNNI